MIKYYCISGPTTNIPHLLYCDDGCSLLTYIPELDNLNLGENDYSNCMTCPTDASTLQTQLTEITRHSIPLTLLIKTA